MWQIAFALIVLLAAGLLVRWLSRRLKSSGGRKRPVDRTHFPYRRADALLSGAEHDFYLLIAPMAQRQRCIVFPKVRLKDLVVVPRGTPNWRGHIGRVCQKHVDFVVCDAGAFALVLVIELDDRSHDSAEAKIKDKFKDDVLAAADLPLWRVRTRRDFDERELESALREQIQSARRSG